MDGRRVREADADVATDAIGEAAGLLLARQPAVVLTGAGISVDSGIPDFRSSDGVWSRFDPMEYGTIEAFRRDPRKVWRMFSDLGETLGGARPNAGHVALAELEAAGLLAGVITQNIDSLHQAAGSRHVIELHGGDSRLVCMRCDRRYPRSEHPPTRAADGSPEPPPCPSCGTILKPDVVLFGEFLPTRALEESTRLARTCRLMLVVGTSALVSPASDLPLVAHQSGAVLVEVNLHRTALTHLCRHRLVGSSAVTLPALAAAVRARLRT